MFFRPLREKGREASVYWREARFQDAAGSLGLVNAIEPLCASLFCFGVALPLGSENLRDMRMNIECVADLPFST
jgi:hypothetical protein